MKHTFKYIAFILALLAYSVSSLAQDVHHTYHNEEKGVATKKTVSSRNDDGTYTITLETFATGSTAVTETFIPADIVLVLDVSSSMDQSDYTYKGTSMRRWRALRAAVLDFVQNIYDKSVEASSKDDSFTGHRIAIVTYCRNATLITNGWMNIEEVVSKSGNTYSGSLIDIINTDSTAGVWASNDNNNKTSGTRPDHGFDMTIDLLLDGSPARARTGANLTVVMFTDGYPTDNYGTELGDPDVESNAAQFEFPIANKTLYYGSLIKQQYNAKLFTVGLISSVNRANNWQWRNYCRVQQMMDWLSSNYPDSKWASVDTDNLYIESAGSNGNHYNGYSNTNSYYTGNNIPSQWRTQWSYTHATNSVSLGGFTAGNTDTDGDKSTMDGVYCKIVDDNTSFDSVFQAISDAAGSAETTVGTSSQVRDVVSSSFVLPEGFNANNVFAYTVDVKTDGLSFFDDEVPTTRPFSNDDSRPHINVLPVNDATAANSLLISSGTKTYPDELDADGQPIERDTICVSGFDFSKDDEPENSGNGNWVGERFINNQYLWYGRKLVLEFKIEEVGDATGGAGTNTNAPGSGVYVYNEDTESYDCLNSFDVPHTTLPVVIRIQKSGLRSGESATFEVWRVRPKNWDNSKSVEDNINAMEYNVIGKPIPGDGWEDWTKVILTNKGANGATVTKTLMALDPYWIYRIQEDKWGWAYELSGYNADNLPNTSTVEVNPFVFTNKEKTDAVKHAEAVSINHFGYEIKSGEFSGKQEEHYKSSKVESF